jgi:hypothetical protein
VEKPVGAHGEHVSGQEDSAKPDAPESDLREQADELAPLREMPPTPASGKSSPQSREMGSSYDSYDERYYLDNEDDEDPKTWLGQRFWGAKEASSTSGPLDKLDTDEVKKEGEEYGTSQAEIADFLTAEPPVLEGHRGLEPVPMSPGTSRTTGDVGLRKSLDGKRPTTGSLDGGGVGISESVARSLASPPVSTGTEDRDKGKSRDGTEES